MMRKIVFAFAAFATITASQAAVLHYSGDFNGANGLAAETNTAVAQAMVYDEFTVSGGGWNISHFGATMLSSTNPASVSYEIRSGVSSGNGGSLIASGSASVDRTLTGSAFGLDVFEYTIAAPMSLSDGTYWLGLSVVGDGTGRNFWGTTSGGNGVGSLGAAYFDSTTFGFSFASVLDPGIANGPNFSFSVNGEPVPEPATMLALAPALAMLRRRKKSA